MEVTPEIYAWLTELNIINSEDKPIIIKKDGNIFIEEEIVNRFLNGFFIDKILYDLEDLYNKFYNIQLNYTQKLDDLKIFQENSKKKKNDINLRNAIWTIVSQVIGNFGIELNEDHIKKLSKGDINTLFYVISSLYFLSEGLRKRSPGKYGKSKFS